MNSSPTNIKPKVEFLMLLDNGHTVPKKLFDGIREQVTEVSHVLSTNDECSLQALCCSDYWTSLTMSERRLAGMCMAYMVKEKKVPYSFAGKLCQSPKLYAVIR